MATPIAIGSAASGATLNRLLTLSGAPKASSTVAVTKPAPISPAA